MNKEKIGNIIGTLGGIITFVLGLIAIWTIPEMVLSFKLALTAGFVFTFSLIVALLLTE